MNQTVNISFEKALLKEIDKIAKREHRSRSELIREAARAYIEKKTKWQAIFDFTSKVIDRSVISEKDVFNEIKSVRNKRNAS
ncbi:CopG family ribbon-helix-helix protein [Leptospira noguchii]|uniref:Ribbon-helix-helix protein, CopG family n=1 Tax=Leptospira noguchii serovar Autumnalis str. ZUN142 TaxID=1085540 RepID=M6US90_9LEPT|nr:ribbon-helix-helix domain-containing protein [Leptospira noguchii]EKR74705.1 ribbon-helix-helix protein, CopG family [Leptospira noguchii str. 2006001870]EMO40143.1 ribbon-helix-helix protein, CopG family [Leptospira noguchii serovar Autumnalis str. ZUN142]EMS86182.1 ribbon-helix-helix protein, CopG family [Leptospira noguchii str. Hook]TQE63647.1 ribbon-helix-helix protein, CopG family [Leptospira noguchii]UOG32660.1 ribbon-helix-helix domain-containing protein [Leptospira noguchii]